MDNQNYDFNQESEIDRYLDDIQNELAFENDTKKEFAIFLGVQVKDLILTGKSVDSNHKIIVEFALNDAIGIICGENVERRENLNNPEKLIIFESVRNAFVDATHALENRHIPEYVGETLLTFYGLITTGVRNEKHKVQWLEFIAYVITELQKQKEPIL